MKFINIFSKPFRKQVFYHDRTRIVYRIFPPKLEIADCKSLQDRIDEGENPIVVDGTVILTSNQIIRGKGTIILASDQLNKELKK